MQAGTEDLGTLFTSGQLKKCRCGTWGKKKWFKLKKKIVSDVPENSIVQATVENVEHVNKDVEITPQ